MYKVRRLHFKSEMPSFMVILLMLNIKLTKLWKVLFNPKTMVANTAYFLVSKWSICRGIDWSIQRRINDQIGLESTGQYQWNIHPAMEPSLGKALSKVKPPISKKPSIVI